MYRVTSLAVADNRRFLVAAAAAFMMLWLFMRPLPYTDAMTNGVVVWWVALCTLSVVNLCVWRLSATAVTQHRDAVDDADYRFQKWQLILSAIYVAGCAFRSVLPRADVQRIGLFDTWLSSVFVGRSVATVAEMCFMAQWAMLLHRVSRAANLRFGVIFAWALVPMITVAEICSWYAVLTTCYLGNAIEESIWALSATLLLVSGAMLWPRVGATGRRFLAAAMALGVGYVAFMVTVDVPMYLTRWLADEASGRTYLTLSQGLHDVGSRWHVTFAWEEWRTEIPWMSLYFSVAVWSSIALIFAPWLTPRPRMAS